MATSHELGREAESIAAATLVRNGWKILNRNWRAGHRELDLVIRRGETVAFVEVKARSASALEHPLAAITAAKRKDLEIAARTWIARFGRAADQYRFDAVTVRPAAGASGPIVRHHADAWRLP